MEHFVQPTQSEGAPSYKVTVLLPFFGKLPPWMDLWAKTCEYNPKYQWNIYTDDSETVLRLPDNVKIVPMTLTELNERASEALGFRISMQKGYKSCDLRPSFGILFKDWLTDSTHWATSDLDTLYGNLEAFFKPEYLSKYSRMFYRGHFTIFQNRKDINEMVLRQNPIRSFQEVMQRHDACIFDEVSGFPRIMEHFGVEIFSEEMVCNFDYNEGRLRLTHLANHIAQVFYFENGHIYQEWPTDQDTERIEWPYAHYQKRKMAVKGVDPSVHKSWFITPTGFEPKLTEKLAQRDFKRFNPPMHAYKANIYRRKLIRRVRRMIETRTWDPYYDGSL